MDRIRFSPTDNSDIEYVGANLRESDLREIKEWYGVNEDPVDALRRSVDRSQAQTATTAAGEPVAIFGVAPISLLGDMASPWMLATKKAEQYPRELICEGRRITAEWAVTYGTLVNRIGVHNARAIRWLRRIGFEVHKPLTLDADFLLFERTHSNS